MSRENLTTYVPNNGNLRIPSKEEFHKYTSNILSDSDFCTEYPTGYTIDAIANSIHLTQKKIREYSYVKKYITKENLR